MSTLDESVEATRPRLLRLAQLNGIEPDEAEDVVQETYLEAWRHLDKLQPDDQAFEERLAAFASAARAHIAYEEAHAWPLLRATISGNEAQQLGEQITKAKKLAPTRPHPHVPPQPGAVKTAGPVAGVADRLRDAVSGRGKPAS